MSYLFAFSYCPWGSQSKNTEGVCHSLLQGTTFCQTSPPWPICLGWPHTAWLSFIELGLWSVWLDWLVFCDYGFNVSALWCPLATPTILLGFLLPWTWGISSLLLQQSTATAPYLGRGISSHGHPSWPWTWSSSSRPSCVHLNQIPYDYTVEMRNRFKGLDLIDGVPNELWMEVHDIVQETGIKTIPWKRNAK